MLPGPASIWTCKWVNLSPSVVTAEDVGTWLYSDGILVKWVAFLGTLHWLADRADLGVGGVSHVGMLVLYELWAGERLVLESASPRYLLPGRPISVSAVPLGLGIDIWRSCRFIGALMRSLCTLPGGLGWFVPCSNGANHCRRRHIAWEKRGHGLTSRPRGTAWESFLNKLLLLFRYPPRSAPALLGGTLPLGYCASRFASEVPTWRFPTEGGVGNLVTTAGEDAGFDEVSSGGTGLDSVDGPGGSGNKFRRGRKTPAHLVQRGTFGYQSRPRGWKKLSVQDHLEGTRDDPKRRRLGSAGRGFCTCSKHGTPLGLCIFLIGVAACMRVWSVYVQTNKQTNQPKQPKQRNNQTSNQRLQACMTSI